MVNYCCVKGCGRNSRVHRHLYYYSLPKERDRQEKWLKAAGKTELLEQVPLASLRFCSRHFEPYSLKNKHLSATAFPSLNLPGPNEDLQDPQPMKHDGVVCNGCHEAIVGFRYKCIACANYDNCQKCEMLEMHSEHPMIRIPKPLKHIKADDLTARWRKLISEEGDIRCARSARTDRNDSSSDDEPITKYAKGYDSGIDLPDDVKKKIRNEVSRVMDLADDRNKKNNHLAVSKKRTAEEILKANKKTRGEDTKNVTEPVATGDVEIPVQELAFADVGEFKLDGDVKFESRATAMYDGTDADGILQVELRNNFSQMMVKVANSDDFILYHNDKNANQ